MMMDQLLDRIRAFDGVLELAPVEGGPFPEVAWGDHFFYYAPDGVVPQREQPYATIVTKDYPDDAACDLDREGHWRLNLHVGRDAFVELIGEEPGASRSAEVDFTEADTVLPHPAYQAQGWIAIVNPGERTDALVARQLREAYDAARRRAARRSPTTAD